MRRVFALLLVMLLLGACTGQVAEGAMTSAPSTTPEPTAVLLPSITVISNGEEHEPYWQMLYRTYYENDQLINEDGGIMLHRTEELPEIAYADDFQIVLKGSYEACEITVQCALYENDYESILAVYRNAIGSSPKSVEDFTFPDEAGVYLLNVEMSWRQGEEAACYAQVFKIRK